MKHAFPHLSSTILGRLLLIFSLATIPLVALAVYLAVDEGRQADANALVEERAATQLVGQDIDLVLQLTRNTVAGVIQKHSDAEICAAIRANRDAFPELLNLSLIEVRREPREAKPVCWATGPLNPKALTISDDEMRLVFDPMRAGEVAVSTVRANAVTGSPVLPVFGLVKDDPGGARRLVVASLDVNWLNSRVNVSQVPDQGALLVLDRNGIIVARNPMSPRWRVGKPAPHFERTLPQRGDFAGEVSNNGEDQISRYYTVRRINGADGMIVLMKRRSSVIFAASRRHLALHLASIVFIFALMFFAAWRNSRKHVAGPLMQLSQAADRLAAGELTVRTGMEYRGEIGRLARSFDGMAVSIERQDLENRELIKSLRESERRFREHLETVELLAVMIDERGIITFCNDFLLKLLGFRRDEVVGRRAIELVAEEDREHSRYPAEGTLAANIENRIVTRNGAKRLIRWNNTFLRDESGAFVGLCGLGVDITEHRALLEQRQQSDRLESVGRLAAGVAHDFNNLLTVINGYSDLALGLVPGDHPLRKSLNEVRKAGEQATALTRQLLTFSRAQVLEPKPVELNHVIQESQSMFGQLLGGRMRLETSLSPGIGEILADKAQLQQVLMNLMTNSMHAMPDGGTISIETSLAAHPDGAPGEWVLLTMRDTGVGMDQETLSHIFDPFYTTRKDGRGTGLGLSIVYGIVRQSNGYLEVESQLGVGTTFRIWWQRAAGSPACAEGAAVQQTETGSETILLVEDREEVRKLMTAMLEKCGYRVLTACDAAEALGLAEAAREKIDLLLTDVVMPGMNGRELAERLTSLDPGLKVIFMSGFAAEVIKPGNAGESGAAFIQKPMTSAALASKVREVLDSRCVPV